MAVESIQGCKGCNLCVQVCPVDVFRMDPTTKQAIIAYPQDCQVCNLCLIYCPVDAITMTNEKTSPVMVSWR